MRVNMHHNAKFGGDWSNGLWDMALFRFLQDVGYHRPGKFKIWIFLTVRRVKRIKVHYSAIFRQLVRYGDISIFLPRADSGAVSK